MKAVSVPTVAVLLLAVAGAPACHPASTATGPPIVQPGAPGAPSRVITADEAADLSRVQHTDADVRFMQGMIGHHGQALDMTALASTRTDREDMRMVALRISLSQEDEIEMMQGWLRERGEEVPGAGDHHAPGAPLMPGMLTAAEMSLLEEAAGAAFDRLFLESMIKHHEGALVMVDELFATPGAGQDSVISAFTADVVADQRAEMDRMGAMLNTMRQEQQP